MIDKQGRLFDKISIIDILIIFAVIVFAAGFLYNRTSADIRQIIAADTPIYVTFVVEGVRDFSFNAVDEGDLLFRQHERTIPLGTVINVTKNDSYSIVVLSDGTAVFAPMEDRYNIHITIRGVGSITDTGFFLNGTQQMSVGGSMTIQSNRFFATVRIYHVGG